jgi:hypothetical protein
MACTGTGSTRTWEPEVWRLAFIMLNPSTADAEVDDPTVVRCEGFARRFGYGGITVMNLYAYRATKPGDMFRAHDPVGPENDDYLRRMLVSRMDAGVDTIAAWGAHAKADRVADVMAMPGASRLTCLGRTKSGQPRHPLMLRKDTALEPYARGGDT